jgi:hypothetical protein
MEVSGQLHPPGRFNPSEIAPGIQWIGEWVGPRAVPDAVVKRNIPSPRWESNPNNSLTKVKEILKIKTCNLAVVLPPHKILNEVGKQN